MGTLIQWSLFIVVILLVITGQVAENEIKSMYFKLSAGICAIMYFQLEILNKLDEDDG